MNDREQIDDELMVYIANGIQNFIDGGSFAPKRGGRPRKISPTEVLTTYSLKQERFETAYALIEYLCFYEVPRRRWKVLPKRARPPEHGKPAQRAKPGVCEPDIKRAEPLDEDTVRAVVIEAMNHYPLLKNLK